MRPADLTLLPTLSSPAVHPDGSWAIVAASYPSLDADTYVGQLWRVDLRGSTSPRRLTRGFADTAPAFSPDGQVVAFVRRQPQGRAQLYVMAAGGGEPLQVTDEPLGVGAFAFSPDSQRLAFLARVPAEGRYGTVEGVDAAAEDPRSIDVLKFQANGLGWSNDRRRHVHVVDVPDPFGAPFVPLIGRAAKAADPDAVGAIPPATQLTTDDTDYDALTFAPDGTLIASAARHASRDGDLLTQLWAVPTEPDEQPRLLTPGADAQEGCFGAGGRLFWTGTELGESHRDFVGRIGGVFTLDESGTTRRLTDKATVQVEPGLAAYGDGVVAVVNDRGRRVPLTVHADGTTTLWPTGEASVLATAELPGDPDHLVVCVATPDTPGELGILNIDGTVTALTDFSGGLRAAATATPPIELTATASDGYPVHGWALVPAGEGPHPVLLNIHGGPQATYGPTFFDEFQVYVDAGYAVVACNPRGSGGYGQEHARIIKGAMGGVDASDILSFLDHALATVPGLDADRVGVMGGSYGGYMSAWLIGHTDRFTAAIVERGFLDTESFIGASDIGWFFVQEYNGPTATQRVPQSPMSVVDHVRTPTLVVHSEQDLRCPLGPALRYYTTLKLNGVETELLVFPGENHELSRSGTPWHRLQRFEAILAWWHRWLPVG